MDEEPSFTQAEADALLPRLRPLLERLREAQRSLSDKGLLERLRSAAAGNGGGTAARAVMETGDEFSRITAEIESLGVMVRDPATGLVDFPAERDGEPVFLCWRMEEDRVAHWHDRDTGFMGRQPL